MVVEKYTSTGRLHVDLSLDLGLSIWGSRFRRWVPRKGNISSFSISMVKLTKPFQILLRNSHKVTQKLLKNFVKLLENFYIFNTACLILITIVL